MASVFIALSKGICIPCLAQRHQYSFLCPKAFVFIDLSKKHLCIHSFVQRNLCIHSFPKGIFIQSFAQRYLLLCRKGICIHCYVQRHLYSYLHQKASVSIALPKGILKHLYLLLCSKASVFIAFCKGSCIH